MRIKPGKRRLLLLIVLAGLCCGCGRDVDESPERSGVNDPGPSTRADWLKPLDRLSLATVTVSPERYDLPDIMGSGCALLDFDRDGRLDIFAVSSTPADNRVPTSVLLRQNADGNFDSVTLPDPTEPEGHGMGVTAGDFNNDGWPDLYVSRYGEDRLLLNSAGKDGQPSFRDVTINSGITNLRWGTSVCCVDYDRDGWLDVFVTNYVDYIPQECVQLSGTNRDFCGPHRFESSPDRLFRNVTGELPPDDDRGVAFRDVSSESGIAELMGAGLGVVAADFTGDDWVDIYVANDQQANFLWVNQQDGTFQERALLLGCACDALGNAQASMGISVHDFDGDTQLDLLLTHLDGERNTLYLRRDDIGFQDASALWGPADHSLTFTGFGVACLETGLPGTVDLVVANGAVRRPDGTGQSAADFWQPYRQPDVVYRIHGPANAVSGASFDTSILPLVDDRPQVSRGLATGDLDGDGDADVVVTSVAGPTTIFENAPSVSGQRHLLTVQATEPDLGGRHSLGALVTMITDNRRSVRLLQTAGSYLCAREPRVRFGFSTDDPPRRLLLNWPDGSTEEFPVDNPDALQKVEHGRGTSQN